MHTGQFYGDDVTRRLRDGGDLTHAGVPFFAAVRDAQLKYIRYFTSDEPEELYDLASDPDELRNRIADPSMAGELRRLRGAWLDEMRYASVDFLDDLPKPVTWSP
jgi:arylsulfatase A-like enzyme